MKTDHDVEGTEEKRGRRVRAPTSQHRYGQVRTLRGYPLRPPTPDDGGERSEPVCTGSVVALQQPTKAAAQAWSVPATPPRSSHHRKGGQPRRDRCRHHRRHQRLTEQVKGHRNGGRHGQRHAPAEGNVLQHCEGTKRGGGGAVQSISGGGCRRKDDTHAAGEVGTTETGHSRYTDGASSDRGAIAVHRKAGRCQ